MGKFDAIERSNFIVQTSKEVFLSMAKKKNNQKNLFFICRQTSKQWCLTVSIIESIFMPPPPPPERSGAYWFTAVRL